MSNSSDAADGGCRTSDKVQSRDLHIQVLGGFSVTVGGRAIDEQHWRKRKPAGIIKLLALADSHRLHREQVLDALWPDRAPRAAANNLHQTLYVARRTLDPCGGGRGPFLRVDNDHLILAPDEMLSVDVDRFTLASDAARVSRQPGAYQTALDLYRGDLLPEDRYDEWLDVHRDGLRHRYLALLLEFVDLLVERGERGSAIEVCRQALARDHTLEEAHVALMRQHAATGHSQQAIRQYQELEEVLDRELGVEPSEPSRQLYRALLDITPDAVPRASLAARLNNLPSTISSFIGREREREGIRDLLRTNRLVTVTGPGGVGKTRLAQIVAREVEERFSDGVGLVELAPLSNPELLASTLASTLGLTDEISRPPLQSLVDGLRARNVLLILDNCEHLIQGCAALVSSVLESCPDLHVLATSREALGLPGEVRYGVAPLPVPEDGSAFDAIASSEAVRLFVERACERDPHFELSERNAGAIVRICRQVEGLPLALELAASRTGVLGVEQIATRLEDALSLLARTGGTLPLRQQTLRATLDWSYTLLTDQEQALFRRLAVFRGGWTLEAAEAAADDGDTLAALAGLVEKSMVVADTAHGAARYRYLEPVRQYAEQRLRASGEEETARRRHAALFLALAQSAQPELNGSLGRWLWRLETEYANLRRALLWHLDHDPESGTQLATALAPFFEYRGHHAEGREWIETMLSRTSRHPTLVRARGLMAAGTMAWRQADYGGARLLHGQSLAAYRYLGDERGVARSLTNLGAQAQNLGDLEQASALFKESRALARRIGDSETLAMAVINLGLLLMEQGQDGAARDLFEEGLELCEALGSDHFRIVVLQNLGETVLRQGEPHRALALHRESLTAAHEIGARVNIAFCLEEVAGDYAALGASDRACLLFGAAEVLRDRLDVPIPPNYRATHYAPTVSALRASLGSRFPHVWQLGRDLSLEEAVRAAMSEDSTPTAAVPSRS